MNKEVWKNIEKEIEKEKITIRVNTSLLSQFDNEDDVANNVLLTKIMIAENRLKILEQIKSELEAWEVVKNKNVKIGTVRTSPNYEVFNSLFNSDTIEKNRITEIEFDIIQKALEVKE